MVILNLLTKNVIHSICVNNHSCREVFAEIYRRNECASLIGTNKCFSKRVAAGASECCNGKDPACWTHSKEHSLYLINCDAKNKQSGQTIVACSHCGINIYDNGLIVIEKSEPEQTTAIYSCTYAVGTTKPSDSPKIPIKDELI